MGIHPSGRFDVDQDLFLVDSCQCVYFFSYRIDTVSEQRRMAGGKVSSTKVSPLHLIPTVAITSLADRFQAGKDRKGDGAWNALSPNQEILTDKEFLIERCDHIILHTLLVRDQLARGESPGEESLIHNAGAILFGGSLLSCAADALSKSTPIVPPAPSPPVWKLELGKSYTTVGNYITGPMSPFTGLISLYSKNCASVTWLPDGTPQKTNQSLTPAEVEAYRIPYGQQGN